jgi:periplasmic divalent cation tolerance protein
VVTDDEPTLASDFGLNESLSLVLVSSPPAEAAGIARALVERRLAACVNVIPRVVSYYRWEGKLQEGEESTLLIKTRTELVPELTRVVRELHSYTLPEVIAIPLERGIGNLAYLAWLVSETRPR